MTLSKLEIQQMLREMNVKFDADETYEELKARLQEVNRGLWLKSVSGDRAATGRDGKVVVRKRKKADEPSATWASQAQRAGSTGTAEKPSALHPQLRKTAHTFRSQAIEKPSAGKPWKAVADGTEPFNRKKNVFESVLRRCGQCCEHCGQPVADGVDPATVLKPYYIEPLSEGGEHSIKNMVALCPACFEAVENDPSAKVIKELKRKTRSKLYDSLQVIRKKTVRKRRPVPNRRK